MRCAAGLFPFLTLLACASAPDPADGGAHEMMAAPMAPVLVARPEKSASLWNQEPQSLFGNRRARNVGDILTVVVAVDENAQMQNSLSASRSNAEDFSLGNLFGLESTVNLPGAGTLNPGVTMSRTANSAGDGSISRQERITLRLAAQVVEKLENGHLVILGTQKIRVNSEVRDLRLYGIVRPDDITRDNTITHDKIASADIVYQGRGQVAARTRPRLGSQILDILVPF